MPGVPIFGVATSAFFVVSATASVGWPQPPQLRAPVGASRQLQNGKAGGCDSVAMRLMPPPAIQGYENCFRDKMKATSTHDWSVPGAEVDAQLQCWCHWNVTATMQEFGCCNHGDVYPMCSVNCKADCKSALAQECVKSCPSMCFEASEYVLDENLCRGCDWVKCWPVLPCLTKHAVKRVEDGALGRTCHETDFQRRPELDNYMQCWKNAPKHSSHWNVLSSIINCICREGMQKATNETDCCGSKWYSGGTCSLKCLSEQECVSQDAQTCIHSCQLKCPSTQMAPTTECAKECLSMDAPCRKYVSCRPVAKSGHICDDGRWPEANSGCCINQNKGGFIGCPRLCDTEKLWRLDRIEGSPWWARRHNGRGIVAQCTCAGCPATEFKAQAKLKATVNEGLWENGQIMLIDIARREGLQYGPNRGMQELMATRNERILAVVNDPSLQSAELDRRIASINAEYHVSITKAAHLYPDKPAEEDKDKEENSAIRTGLILALVLVSAIALAALYCLCFRRNQKHSTNISEFRQTGDVVIGQPVPVGPDPAQQGVMISGTPVTVSAPTKGSDLPDNKNQKQQPVDFSSPPGF